MVRLNLGCGFDKRPGYVNADVFARCAPDVLLNLERTPWPFRDGVAEEIVLRHVLEHLGADFRSFGAVVRELYRVVAPGGRIDIAVPHYRHESWWADPSHVRAFTPMTFRMLSRRQNEAWMASRANFTMLAAMLDVDFELEEAAFVYDPRWWARVRCGELTEEGLKDLAEREWGVIAELQVRLRAVKD